VKLDTLESRSRASSFGSKQNSSTHGSVPSIDLVSPAAFMFSGPSLHSMPSLNDSASRLPSLAESGSGDIQPPLRGARTDSFSMLDDASALDEGILEPINEGDIVRTMSDVLLGAGDPMEGVITPMPDESQRRGGHSVPFEIIQQVFGYLGPKDFNAARHTCCNWMRASLDKSLLATMLTRGAWWSSAQVDIEETKSPTFDEPRPLLQSEEWLLSRHLSRQCSLASGWTGNGLDARPVVVEDSCVDFTALANGCSTTDASPRGSLVFSVSVCGNFLMVARDTLIYMYDTRNGFLVPITSVVCPRRVLSMSMDTSSGHHAVAALLEGRMGMVCELRYGIQPRDESPPEIFVEKSDRSAHTSTRTTILTSRVSDFEDSMDFAEHRSSNLRRMFPYAQERDGEPFSGIDVR